MKKTLFSIALTISMAGATTFAHAADPFDEDRFDGSNQPVVYPYIDGELIWELQGDFTKDSDDPDAELNDIFGYLELAASVYLAKEFQINFALIGEPVLDPGPMEDRFFEDHGLYLEVLNAQINLSDYTNVVVGKFGPGFGTAWDATPGIYGVDFAEDYQLAEFIGIGFNHTFDGSSFGMVTFGASAFFADTTFLSDSIGTRRGRTVLADGGAGNTEELNNVSFTLDGEDLPEFDGF